MMKNMLKAVSKMLEIKTGDDPAAIRTRVGCAKTIIDELVDGMFNAHLNGPMPTVLARDPAPKPKAPTEPRYEAVAKDGKLVEIKGLKEDAFIELNGKKMRYSEAKGKPFQTIKML